MSRRIAVVGSVNVDLVSLMEDVPTVGETIVGKDFSIHMGGKGANQALMAARAGADISFICGVGIDDFGKSALENLARNGVDVSEATTFPCSTGVAHIWVNRKGENRIVLNPGANERLTAEIVSEKLIGIPDLSIVVAQLEIPIEVVISAFEAGKSRGAITILNPAPFRELPEVLLNLTDWLILNEVEFAGIHPRSLSPETEEIVREVGFEKLIVTLGADGALLVDGKFLRIPAPTTSAIDTTGAGDCLVGSFAAGLALGLEPEISLRFAVACASESIKTIGAQSSYPSKELAKKFVRSLAPDFH